MLTLQECKERVDAELAVQYRKYAQEASIIDPEYKRLLDEMALFMARGGKRLRPYLAYVMYIGLGGSNEQAIIQLGVALELFHHFLLVHDDIIDNDLTRYGGLNISGVFTEKLQSRHGGEAVGLLAGDVTLALSLQCFNAIEMSRAKKHVLMDWLFSSFFTVCGGEFVDSFASQLQDTPRTIEQILSICIDKTALYSFDFPMRLGALLAGRADLADDMLKIAIPWGIAYQVHDDYLGLFGDEKMTGKPVIGDIREGKQTYIHALTEELLSSDAVTLLRSLYGKADITEREAEQVRSLIIHSGATKKGALLVRTLAVKARENMDALPLNDEAEAILSRLIQESITRTA